MAKTTLRNVRIDDELWRAVQAKAERDGQSVSVVIRELLAHWISR